MLQLMYNVYTLCHMTTFPPPMHTFATNLQLQFLLIQLVQPLQSIIVQLCYDHNAIVYNLIRIHIHI